ncbi:hypothetical protein WR25_25512 [Diploscapter pachys]|uniref:Uncharacterized protein n=1 Tax=Diploscapter pachys TaxID=2018661 RepID=A0A2A2JFE3_9BILA|nr:hypothetical protein WR25_25512 [Diploscapter pachys]
MELEEEKEEGDEDVEGMGKRFVKTKMKMKHRITPEPLRAVNENMDNAESEWMTAKHCTPNSVLFFLPGKLPKGMPSGRSRM